MTDQHELYLDTCHLVDIILCFKVKSKIPNFYNFLEISLDKNIANRKYFQIIILYNPYTPKVIDYRNGTYIFLRMK